MKYTSCPFINHYLCFNDNRILYCTVGNQSKSKEYAVIKENYNGETINWDKILDKIENDKNNFKNGKILKSCENCLMLFEHNWDREVPPRKFKYVLFSNWFACNSACRYCWKDNKNFLIEDIEENSIIDEHDTYDIIPIVKDLINKKLLTEDATIDFAGGEPTMYYKFNEALELFTEANIKNIVIHTNAIIYSKQIEKAVKKGIANLTVSVDAGTKETHQKVKRVVSFERVLKNLEKYCKALKPKNKNKVRSKFVIVPKYNDTEEEILLWIKKAAEIGVSELILNADDCIFMKKRINKKDLKKIVELSEYFLETVKKENLRYRLFTNVLNAYSVIGTERPEVFG